MIRKSLTESTEKTEKPLNDFKVVWENFKKYKEATLGEAATYRDACKLREAVKAANEKGIFLKEAEIPTSEKPHIQENAEEPKTEETKVQESTETPETTATKVEESTEKVEETTEKVQEAEVVPGAAPAAAPVDPAAAAAPAPEAAPAATPSISPEVQQQITQLQAALDALKAAAGIEVNEFGSAPTSDIGAVTGQNPEGVADAAAQPVMEAFDAIRTNGKKIDEATFKNVMAEKGAALIEKYGDRENRIAYRAAKLDIMNEHYKGDLGKAYLTHLGVLQESKDDWDHIPSEEELAKGYASGPAAKEIKPAKTWPTKDIPASETKGLKESEEKKEEEAKEEPKKEEKAEETKTGEKKVEESVETKTEAPTKISESEVTTRYVENYFAPKLDFKSLKESMKTGLLG